MRIFIQTPSFKNLIAAFLLLFLVQFSFGQTIVSHTFSATSGTIDSNITFTTQTNSASTAPAFNAGDSTLRLYYGSASPYNGCSITLNALNGATITAVEMYGVSGTTPTLRYSVGSTTTTTSDPTLALSGTTYTVSSLAITTSMKIRNANTSNVQGRFTGIKVTYTPSTPAVVVPTVSTTTASAITINSASSGGNVSADGGATVNARGIVYNTVAAPTLSNSVVTTGTGTGSYVSALSSLSVNTRYYYRAYATNSAGTGYGTEANFYTLANAPGTLVVGTAAPTTIQLSFNTATQNGNPAITTYAIQETGGGLYVQANGSLGATAVWQTVATWGTVTVSGLINSTTYNFRTKAKNGSDVETAFGTAVPGTTTAPVAPVVTNGSPAGTYNVAFTYTIVASNTPTSYAIASGSTLPAGLTLNTTSGVISGTPSAAGSYSVNVTATNAGGTGTGTLSFTIAKVNQTITFATTDSKVYGTANYTPSATSATSGTNAITYTSNNALVATIVSNQVHIVGVGTATITASQAANTNYNAATANQTLTVTKKALTITGITANSKVQDGTTAATLSVNAALVGVVSGDEGNLTLGGTVTATFASAAPATGIVVTVSGYVLSGSASGNYTLSQPTGLTANITALGLPTATDATNLLYNGFTANWNAVTGATGYVLDVYKKVGTSVVTKLGENFNGFSGSGTGSNAGTIDRATTLDTYTQVSGWAGVRVYEAGGTVKMGASGTLGSLTTPSIDLSGNGGAFTVSFKAMAWSGDSTQLKLYLDNVLVNTVTGLNNSTYTLSSFSVNLTGGTSASKLRFEGNSASNSRFFLEDVAITQGGQVITPVSGSPFSVAAPAISHTVTGLAAETTYYYTVKSVNGSVTSAVFNEITAITKPTPVTWNGSAWSNVTGPTAAIGAIIQGAYSTANDSHNLGGFTADKLTLASGSFTITSGHTVTVVTDVINSLTAADFVIENNANLIQQGTSNNNLGGITVNRNSAAVKRLDYTLWSSPVSDQGLYAFSPYTLTSPTVRFYTYNPTTDAYNPVIGFHIENANSDGVNGVDSNLVPFAKGTSYLIRAPWNHPTAATIWPGIFKGIPNNGDITLNSLITSGKYYAIGNPYPSTISADDFINANNLSDAIYFWRKTNLAEGSAYATYTLAGGTTPQPGTAAGAGDPNHARPNGMIQVGQGFIAKAASSSFVFHNSMRTASYGNQFFRSASGVERNRIWLNLTNVTGLNSETMVAYMTNATSGIDAAIDGKYINDSQTALTSIIEGQEFSVQGRAVPFDNSDVVPLGFKAETAGNYTISLSDSDGLFANGEQAIYLKDTMTNEQHNLKDGAYTFSSASGIFNQRFEIVYQNTLGINPVFEANSVVIYNQNNEFVVNSGNTIMASIKVFDIRGRLIEEKKGINANQVIVKGGLETQVLLVQITSTDGIVVTKKVIKQ